MAKSRTSALFNIWKAYYGKLLKSGWIVKTADMKVNDSSSHPREELLGVFGGGDGTGGGGGPRFSKLPEPVSDQNM